MKQSKLCKICACTRHDYEKDGYVLYDRVEGLSGCRSWFYRHPNGNRLTIELNLNTCIMRVYKNALIIQIVQ